MSTPRTIVAVGTGARTERVAGGAITPGDLIEINTADAFIRNGTAAVKAAPTFAIENEIFGKGVYNDGVLYAYASGDRVLAETLGPGAEVYATLAASAAAIVIGDALDSAGDGTLKKASAETTAGIIARAREAVDNSGGGAKVHIRAAIV